MTAMAEAGQHKTKQHIKVLGFHNHTNNKTEEQLLSYVVAQDELSKIRYLYSDKILKASDERDAGLLVEAKRAMADAIQKAGLYREEYANISLAIDADSELRSRVQKMMRAHSY
jgi:hypothetical protein